LADEHHTKKASLQVDCDTRTEEAKCKLFLTFVVTNNFLALAKQCADIEAELVRNSSSTTSMASRLDEKLQAEREHVLNLETEKREAEVKVRLVQFEVESLKLKLTEFEQEMNRLKSRVEMTTKELQEEEDKNHQLEVALKQLEAKI
jgi:chromosome segregation ATPase